MSKYSATMIPPAGSIRARLREICQFRDASGSWLSSVETRPLNANRRTGAAVSGPGASRTALTWARPGGEAARRRAAGQAAARPVVADGQPGSTAAGRRAAGEAGQEPAEQGVFLG